MKRTYEKPGLFIESFALAQSIAAGCTAVSHSTTGYPALASKGSCGWNVGDGETIVWVNGSSDNCNDLYDPDGYEGVCYNNPNGSTVFHS